jgi:hypothetical protein
MLTAHGGSIDLLDATGGAAFRLYLPIDRQLDLPRS